MKKCYAYNLALKRDDGKIEMDTVYYANLLTQDLVDEISEHYNCEVIFYYVGTLHYARKSVQERNTLKGKPAGIFYKKDDTVDDLNTNNEKENVDGNKKEIE